MDSIFCKLVKTQKNAFNFFKFQKAFKNIDLLFFASEKKPQSYRNIFSKLKKLKNHGNNFCKLKNLKKHEFVFWKFNKLRKHGF